jgi:ankyrin repeat protein
MAESDSPISTHLDLPESPSQIIGRRRNRLVNIIKQNNLPQLRQFIASYSPEDVIAPGTPYLEDTLFNAASYGSPEALHILLEVYTAAPENVKRFNPKFCLLLDACGAANIDVVRFILDSHDSSENRLPLGTVDLHQRDDSGDTPILAATGSLMYLDKDADEVEDKGLHWNEWFRNRIARSHQLINFLLDRGCSATDVIRPLSNDLSPWGSQVQDSVLGLAVSRANGSLIQRLIDSGADIYLKHQHFHHAKVPLQSRATKAHTHDVTTLHLASLFYNTDAVRLLLDHQNSKNNANPGLATSCDSDGRLPLHWAASGPGDFNCKLQDKQLRITETLRLLLDHDSTGVNLVDNTGSTPLHYAAISYAVCGCSQYAELAIRTLLEYRADPRIPDKSGCTILHLLGYHSHQGDPINTTILDLILSHGANINHTENNGKTALHVFAQNLRQVPAAKFLIEHGADFRVQNTLRETPFHAAARGILNDHVRREGRDKEVTTANKIRLQDEMMLALKDAAGEDTAMLTSQPNAEGKTPQNLLEETRNRWQGTAQPIPGSGRGRGRGRGQPVGADYN